MQCLSLPCYVSVDVDECSDPSLNSCDLVNGQCINVYGFYTCHCNTGYEGVRGICVGKITMHYIHVCVCSAACNFNIVSCEDLGRCDSLPNPLKEVYV